MKAISPFHLSLSVGNKLRNEWSKGIDIVTTSFFKKLVAMI